MTNVNNPKPPSALELRWNPPFPLFMIQASLLSVER
jgi:hypothetical protein